MLYAAGCASVVTGVILGCDAVLERRAQAKARVVLATPAYEGALWGASQDQPLLHVSHDVTTLVSVPGVLLHALHTLVAADPGRSLPAKLTFDKTSHVATALDQHVTFRKLGGSGACGSPAQNLILPLKASTLARDPAAQDLLTVTQEDLAVQQLSWLRWEEARVRVVTQLAQGTPAWLIDPAREVDAASAENQLLKSTTAVRILSPAAYKARVTAARDTVDGTTRVTWQLVGAGLLILSGAAGMLR